MTQGDLLHQAQIYYDYCWQLLAKKSNDYAEEQDALSNFKEAAHMANVPVEKVFMVMLGIKFCRLRELTNGKTAKNESVVDTLVDICNYSFLMSQYLTTKDNPKPLLKAVYDAN